MKASTVLGTCMAPFVIRGWFRKSFSIPNKNKWHRIIMQSNIGLTRYFFACQQNQPINTDNWKQNTNFGLNPYPEYRCQNCEKAIKRFLEVKV